MATILVVAPHPDDEVLGVGGTVFRLKEEGHKVNLVLVTSISEGAGWEAEVIACKKLEIKNVIDFMGFEDVYFLNYPPTTLDGIRFSDLVGSLSAVLTKCQPQVLYIPYQHDIHSDHQVVFRAVISASKWFRQSSIRRIYSYETLSETGICGMKHFSPNVYVDIDKYISFKIEAMKKYSSELGLPPFPRSIDAITALAKIRGSESGFLHAESFELIIDRS